MREGVKNLLLYSVIGVGIVGGAVLYGIFTPERFLLSRVWFTFGGATAFLCFFVSKMYWHEKKSGKLWIVLALLLVGHVAVHTIVFQRFPQFPTILFLLTVPLEIMLVAAIVKVCLNVMPGKVKL